MWPSWSTKRMETSLSRAADTIYSSLANRRRREPMNGGNWQQSNMAVQCLVPFVSAVYTCHYYYAAMTVMQQPIVHQQ